jgi:hypothetical protein
MKNKKINKKNNDFIFLKTRFLFVGAFIVFCITVFLLFLLSITSLGGDMSSVHKKIFSLQNQVNEMADKISKLTREEIVLTVQSKKYKRNFEVSLKANQGYIIYSYLVSNNDEAVVYSEISSCFSAASVNSNYACSWDFNIYVQNVLDGRVKKIYSQPGDQTDLCATAYVPKAWTKNDKKIILSPEMPVRCPKTELRNISYVIDPGSGNLQYLSSGSVLYLEDYSKAIMTDENILSMNYCDAGSPRNGRIILKDLETFQTQELISETNKEYRLVSVNADGTVVDYNAFDVIKTNKDCGQVNFSTVEKRKLMLKKL